MRTDDRCTACDDGRHDDCNVFGGDACCCAYARGRAALQRGKRLNDPELYMLLAGVYALIVGQFVMSLSTAAWNWLILPAHLLAFVLMCPAALSLWWGSVREQVREDRRS